jgi:ubiquinone/menaquinone biosynthesis C-methylase UbiE
MHGRMLDFGCGSKPYESLFAVAEYVGLDLAESGHAHEGESIDVFYDGQRIPFPDQHFDSVFSSEVLEHVFNLEHVLAEIFRVTKDGGTLLLSAPFVWDEHEAPYDFARYTSFAFEHVLQRAGFTVISLEKSGSYVETIFQMWNAYVFQHILPSNRWLRQLMTPAFVAPTTCAGLMLGRILPRDRSFYLSSIVVAQKPFAEPLAS